MVNIVNCIGLRDTSEFYELTSGLSMSIFFKKKKKRFDVTNGKTLTRPGAAGMVEAEVQFEEVDLEALTHSAYLPPRNHNVSTSVLLCLPVCFTADPQ